MRIVLQQQIEWLDSDLETVIGLFLNRIGQSPSVLLESAAMDGRWGRYSLAATDFLLTARAVGGRLELTVDDPRLVPLQNLAGRPFLEGLRGIIDALCLEPALELPLLPPITRALYGYLGYGVAGMMEKKLASVVPAEEAEAVFVLPGRIYFFDHVYNRLARISLRKDKVPLILKLALGEALGASSSPESFEFEEKSSFSREDFISAVQHIQGLIRYGEAIQVVLSAQFSVPFAGDLFKVYRRLRHINPSPYMFFQRLPEISLAVSSPEVMISCEKGHLRLCPIAGTRPRGRTEAEDSKLAEELKADLKEQSEHIMLVDLGRNDLGRVAAPGTVKVEAYMEVERFSHVMHLTSQLSAKLADGRNVIDILSAVFPAGTLSGAPKVRAMEIIAAHEKVARGPYGGALGWLGLDKDSINLDLGITIRGLWTKGGQAFWQAGAGLVYDSDPDREWQECRHKSKVIRQALAAAGR
ncbi:MAG: anthranilate synthase [Candidatus Adiutrix intracellularis]|nr:MAG: anthranilate synthase [Candidatus Adiutrix intracellularis]